MSKMRRSKSAAGEMNVGAALRRRMTMFTGVGIFSGVINMLALTGSMYMLQVYDRVIPSRSVPTLIGLSILMLGLYSFNGLLDMLRSRIMTRIGLKFDKDLRAKVFDIVLLLPLKFSRSDKVQPIQDLDQIRSFLATPGPVALFDIPWIPIFILIIYWMHPWLGLLAIVGAITLLSLAGVTEAASRKPVRAAAASGSNRQSFSDAARKNAEIIRALGMGERMKAIWLEQSRRHLIDQLDASDVVGGLGAASKVLRMILQSAMLGLGAYLVIMGEASAGVMIAGSILLSRALAPIEIAIANWRGFIAARQSYRRLKQLFSSTPAPSDVMPLPAPQHSLAVEGLWVGAPGDPKPIVQNISFSLNAGAGLGVIGKSASGKSTLARALVGVWEPLPQRGVVRLDGAALNQWVPEQLGRHIGYPPQQIELFEGTVAQNIARFDPEMTSGTIIEAATKAGVHDMILHMENGYDTTIGHSGETLSAGQRQRIGLARALYDDPFLVVLDEPNSNLDLQGEAALGRAISAVRARGGIVIVIAHRSAALAHVDQVLAIADGQTLAFGPRDEVLAQLSNGETGAAAGGGSPKASAANPNGSVQRGQRPVEIWTSAGRVAPTGMTARVNGIGAAGSAGKAVGPAAEHDTNRGAANGSAMSSGGPGSGAANGVHRGGLTGNKTAAENPAPANFINDCNDDGSAKNATAVRGGMLDKAAIDRIVLDKFRGAK